MSFAFGEIRQERHDCYSVFYEGGPGIECRRYDKQFPSFDEAWEWVRAKHLEIMTPKVKKAALDAVATMAMTFDPAEHIENWPQPAPAQWRALMGADVAPADEPVAPGAPKIAETATGDQAGSAEARGLSDEDGWVSTGPVGPASVMGSVLTGTLGRDVPEVLAKRRGRPPKVGV